MSSIYGVYKTKTECYKFIHECLEAGMAIEIIRLQVARRFGFGPRLVDNYLELEYQARQVIQGTKPESEDRPDIEDPGVPSDETEPDTPPEADTGDLSE